jgi:hypothetical protein
MTPKTWGAEGQAAGKLAGARAKKTKAESVKASAMDDREDGISRRDRLSDGFNVAEANL